ALTYTIQDILMRYHRMRGHPALWQPGTDHAGIATQMMVERKLQLEGKSRHDLGREAFLKEVWDWRDLYGDQIIKQQRRLGVSADWSRQKFTLDEDMSHAVTTAFVRLYEQGLIYRDKRLVYWDIKLQTALSDLEVENVETKGNMYYFRYPLATDPNTFITIATTRPETLFGDTAVAVHPEDERYQHLIGQHVRQPFTNRLIPIIADAYCDPEKGTGAVKITPAHDFNDFEVGRRHQLEAITIMDTHGVLCTPAPAEFCGLDRFEARTKVIAELEALGLLEKIETTSHAVPHGDRSGSILEPRLTDQWFVDAKVLAEPALKAVEEGRIRIIPEASRATYNHWLTHIQPWCISRQLWWGHRIPAWFGPDESIFVAFTAEEAAAKAKVHYGHAVEVRQDEDVLETWFSSALFPFSTLGWPNETADLKRFYPTSVLVTGADILFFWVARMIMTGLHLVGDIPFRDVYLHALVRDEKGHKMSKTKGNVIDPMDMIEAYGTDALRFSLAALAAPGRDLRFSKATVELYRNFATKVWNAARFCTQNGCNYDPKYDPSEVTNDLNRWILAKLKATKVGVEKALAEYRFDAAALELYHLIWGQFCDWFIELAKPILQGEDNPAKAETQATAAFVLVEVCHLLHPFMPFLTQKLYSHFAGDAAGLLVQASWPQYTWDVGHVDEVDGLIDFITKVRSMRAAVNMPPAEWLRLYVADAAPQQQQRLTVHMMLIKRLARLEDLDFFAANTELPKGMRGLLGDMTLVMPLGDSIDLDAEHQRLSKQLITLEKEIKSVRAKLENADFMARAPEEVVDKNRERLAEAERDVVRIQDVLSLLKS
ncbi:MAG: valine--tRNA ligase, partial [Holosporales bacterium]